MWTEELLTYLFISRARNFKRQAKKPNENSAPVYKKVSNDELFRAMGFEPEVVGRT